MIRFTLISFSWLKKLLIETIRSPIGQPILVQDYILQVFGKPFLEALTNGDMFIAMGFN